MVIWFVQDARRTHIAFDAMTLKSFLIGSGFCQRNADYLYSHNNYMSSQRRTHKFYCQLCPVEVGIGKTTQNWNQKIRIQIYQNGQTKGWQNMALLTQAESKSFLNFCLALWSLLGFFLSTIIADFCLRSIKTMWADFPEYTSLVFLFSCLHTPTVSNFKQKHWLIRMGQCTTKCVVYNIFTIFQWCFLSEQPWRWLRDWMRTESYTYPY